MGSAYFIDATNARAGPTARSAVGKPLTLALQVQKIAPGDSFYLNSWAGDAISYTLSVSRQASALLKPQAKRARSTETEVCVTAHSSVCTEVRRVCTESAGNCTPSACEPSASARSPRPCWPAPPRSCRRDYGSRSCDSDPLAACVAQRTGREHLRATLDVPAVMRERPVLAAARHFVRGVLDGDHAAAGEWADVRLALLVERHIPSGDGARPVVQHAVELSRPSWCSRSGNRAG